MSEEEYKRYVKMLITCSFMTDAVNEKLKSYGLGLRISNCSMECKGKYSKFLFETKNLPEGKTFIDVLGEDENETDGI